MEKKNIFDYHYYLFIVKFSISKIKCQKQRLANNRTLVFVFSLFK